MNFFFTRKAQVGNERKKLILFCDREIFHRTRCAPAAKEAGNFPCLKKLPVSKWREKFRFLLLVRKATILIGSGKKVELTPVQEIYIICKKAVLVLHFIQYFEGAVI